MSMHTVSSRINQNCNCLGKQYQVVMFSVRTTRKLVVIVLIGQTNFQYFEISLKIFNRNVNIITNVSFHN